jgi:hypothetical protein
VVKDNIKGSGHLCKRHVGIATPSSHWLQRWNNQSFTSHQKLPKTLPKTLSLADMMLEDALRLFLHGRIKVSLNDPASGHQMISHNSAHFSSWPRSGNDYVISSADLLSPVDNMSKILTLRAGYQKYGESENTRCILSVAMTSSKDSPPPIITDLAPGHNQIVEFDCSSGSSSIDIDKVFAKKPLGEALSNQRAIWCCIRL